MMRNDSRHLFLSSLYLLVAFELAFLSVFLITPTNIHSSDQPGPSPDLDLTKFPVLIRTEQVGKAPQRGTGFYVHDDKHIYLITSGHILYGDRQGKLLGPKSEVTSSESPHRLSLDLEKLVSSGNFFLHARYDIVVLRIGKIDRGKWHYHESVTDDSPDSAKPYSVSISRLKPYANVDLRGKLTFSGYPSSLDPPSLKTTKLRSRSVDIVGKFDDEELFLVRLKAYHGDSGSPIYSIENEQGNQRVTIFGILFRIYDEGKDLQGKSVKFALPYHFGCAAPLNAVLDLIRISRSSDSVRGSSLSKRDFVRCPNPEGKYYPDQRILALDFGDKRFEIPVDSFQPSNH